MKTSQGFTKKKQKKNRPLKANKKWMMNCPAKAAPLKIKMLMVCGAQLVHIAQNARCIAHPESWLINFLNFTILFKCHAIPAHMPHHGVYTFHVANSFDAFNIP